VTYGAVGATQAPDLLSFPPPGFRATERRARIGHGPERWEFACAETMTWGIKRRAGFRVEQIAATTGPKTETVYSATGHEFVHPGDTAVLVFGWLRLREPVRVVYTIAEEQRRGFAYGTLPGHPLEGEESFVVERRADDSVWITVRAFSRPSTRGWRAVSPLLRLVQAYFTRRYLAALAGPIG
jgi:uncharacterized protein (UPF0548 family)